MLVKPEALFWARVKNTFPAVAVFMFYKNFPNTARIRPGEVFERPMHITFTFGGDAIKFERRSFGDLEIDDETWSDELINLNMHLYRAEVLKDSLLMISLTNYSGFSNATRDRCMVRFNYSVRRTLIFVDR